MKQRITISLDKELIEWIDQQVRDKVEFSNRSHLIEIAITRFKETLRN